MSGLKVTRIATAGQELAGGYALDATYAGDDADVTTGLPLDGLLDVNAPLPDDNDVLTWDDAAGEWIAAPGGGGNDVELVTVAAAGATETIDVSVARTYDVTLTADCTLTLTGAVTGEAWFVALFLRQDSVTGGWDVTWPASVEWMGGTAPTIDPAVNAVTVVTLGTLDGGTTWYGFPTGGGGSATDTSLSTVAASGATETLDVSVARTHDLTLTADCTLTFTGAVAAEAWFFTLLLRQDGTGGWDTSWPGSVVWPGGVTPTPDTTASTSAVFTFFTVDAGTTWYGFASGEGGSGTPATTVTDETTWGIAPAVGSDTEYARQDHTHGTPAQPTGGGTLLISDTPSTPLVFADLIQNEAQDDLVYAD